MPLANGARVGPYEITGFIGAVQAVAEPHRVEGLKCRTVNA